MTEFDYKIVKDPQAYAQNTLPPHSDHIAFAPEDRPENMQTSFRRSLNGMWRFHYAENYRSAPDGFWKDDFDVSGWTEISVPSNMQMEGYDKPAYVNTQYPWDGLEPIEPGQIPERHNPVGQYVRTFRLPDGWKQDSVRISFQGVESGFALWLNGRYVGYAEDSFTPSEFDLTPFLQDGENRIAVLVFKWTAGSWCEDQDMYRFSGIFRDVYLERIPKVHLRDVKILADYQAEESAGLLDVTLKLTGSASGAAVGYRLEKLGVLESLADRKEGEEIKTGRICVAGDETHLFNREQPLELYIREKLDDPLAWSAEIPNLYRLTLTVEKNGELFETVRELVGFRHFEMKDGLMCLNGRRVVFRGVNRHEFSCDTGRKPNPDEILRAVTIMKQNHINAVRTCHYPDASVLYRLCDIFGIYMIAENNMETHGMWDRVGRHKIGIEQALPGDRTEWEPMMISRIRSMVELEKNHPAILIWSCGNESFGGSVIWHMAQELRRLDGSRLVHYEGIRNDRRYPDTSDMESQMYTPVREVEAFLKEHPEKPFILCEYSHSMGNSNGGLFKYTELTKREPRYQGGFIWDFIDQAIRMKNRYGEEYLGYGGDNHERPTDYEFSGNGILRATGEPYSGKMQEVRACYQELDIEIHKDEKRGLEAAVTNRNLFLGTGAFDCRAELRTGNRVLERLSIPADVAPGKAEIFTLPFRLPEKDESVVSLSFYLRKDTIWGKAGDEVAYGERILNSLENEKKTLESAPDGMREDGTSFILNGVRTLPVQTDEETCSLEVVRGGLNTGIFGTNFSALFSSLKGGLVSYIYGGRELIEKIPRPNFWRAPTNNDEGCRMPARCGIWKLASLYQTFIKPGSNPYIPGDDNGEPKVHQTAGYVDLTWKKYIPVPSYEAVSSVKTTYRVFPDGTIRMILDWEPDAALAKQLPAMPEFGWIFALDADLCQVRYYGLGPEENYCDRRKGARLGIYERESGAMVEPYLVPQETGNRTGVRWAEVTDRKGHGVRFSAPYFEDGGDPEASRPGSMEFSAIPYSPEMLETARHPYELPRSSCTYVRCMLKQMGVAGDDSWGAQTHPEFLVKSGGRLTFAVDFRGI